MPRSCHYVVHGETNDAVFCAEPHELLVAQGVAEVLGPTYRVCAAGSVAWANWDDQLARAAGKIGLVHLELASAATDLDPETVNETVERYHPEYRDLLKAARIGDLLRQGGPSPEQARASDDVPEGDTHAAQPAMNPRMARVLALLNPLVRIDGCVMGLTRQMRSIPDAPNGTVDVSLQIEQQHRIAALILHLKEQVQLADAACLGIGATLEDLVEKPTVWEVRCRTILRTLADVLASLPHCSSAHREMQLVNDCACELAMFTQQLQLAFEALESAPPPNRSSRMPEEVGRTPTEKQGGDPPSPKPASGVAPEFSPNYQSALIGGVKYTFTKKQAACVRAMWELSKQGKHSFAQAAVFERAAEEVTIKSKRLDHVFRSGKTGATAKQHPFWNSVLIPEESRPGWYQLRLEPLT